MRDYKLLRINLTEQSFKEENIPIKILERYIGGKGLGSYYLLKEVPPKCDPLGEKAKLIFVAGPLTGTFFPTSNRYGVIFKSPLTGTYAEGYSGGNVGKFIQQCGYMAIIVEGISQSPVYLTIRPGEVLFNDAADLWGKDTFETIKILLENSETYRNDRDVLAIGPAGENLVRYASIQNNFFHSLGRCGPGAVLGSKKVKAILFDNPGKVPIDSDEKYRDYIIKTIYKKLKEASALYGKDGLYRKLGTASIVKWANEIGCFPTRYFSKGYHPDYKKLTAEYLVENYLKKRVGCWNCPFGCGKVVEIEGGPYKAKIEGPEYETIALIGGNLEIIDFPGIIKVNEFCDAMGLDTIEVGNVVGLVIESIHRGKIPKQKDIDLDYGKPLAVIKFLEKVISGEGLGKDAALGIKHLEEKYGLEDFAMHVKGLGFAGYDPRQFRGFTLSYGVAPEGPTHLRSTYHGIERLLPNRLSYENKVIPMMEQENKMALLDSFIMCKFIRGAVDFKEMADLYTIIFDKPMDVEGLNKIADDIIRLSRIFNVKAGFSRKDDYMPKRAYNEYLAGLDGSKTKLDMEPYDKLLDEYYELRNWDSNGIPRDMQID